MSQPGLVILISGRGSNALAIIEAARDGRLPAEIRAVIADGPAAGLELAQQLGIDTVQIARDRFPDRTAFEQALAEAIEAFRPELVALAGFMRVLSREFVTRFAGRMVNIHPSLLPKYRGLDTHARALAAGDREHGASVHWVTPQLDAGPVIARARVAILPGDDPQRLSERVLEQEHRLYPAALALLLSEPVTHGHECNDETDALELDRDLDVDGRRIAG